MALKFTLLTGGVQRETFTKFLLQKVPDFFSPSPFPFVYGLAICSKLYFFLSQRSLASNPPPPPLICLSRFFSPLPILHPSSLHGPALSFPSSPLLSSFHPSLLMSLSISNCEPSVAQGRGRAQAKLALTSTPPLPSGWESFNAPLESSSDLRSFLAPSLPLPPPNR